MINDEELKEYLEDNHIPPSAIEELTSELLQRREEARKTCKWKLDYYGFMVPECSPSKFLVYEESLRVGFKFCPYCGHHIEEAQ